MAANDRQVGAAHYKDRKIEHWDLVAYYGWDYFQGQIIKYVMRWRDKNGVEDLEKAQHFLEKYIELLQEDGVNHDAKVESGVGEEPTGAYVNQD